MRIDNKKFGHYVTRRDYTKVSGDLELPNLIEIQTKTYDWFINKGIQSTFNEVFPILGQEDNIVLNIEEWWFDDFKKDRHKVKAESKILEKPLNAKLTLSINSENNFIEKNEDFIDLQSSIISWMRNAAQQDLKIILIKENQNVFLFEINYSSEDLVSATVEVINENENGFYVNVQIIRSGNVFFGDFPWMTEKGTFIINGSEKVIVSQLVRSPGAYFKTNINQKTGENLYYVDLIPSRGIWLEFESVEKKNKKDSSVQEDSFYVKIDKSRKVTVTNFFTALGLNKETIEDIYDNNIYIKNTYDHDGLLGDDKYDKKSAIQEIYKKIRSGEVATPDGAAKYLFGLLFDKRKYDLTKAGRFKLKQKLAIENRLINKVIAEDIIDGKGNVVIPKDTLITKKHLRQIHQATLDGACEKQVNFNEEIQSSKIINKIRVYKNKDMTDELITIIGISPKSDELHITIPDIISAFSYLLNLTEGIGEVDDIDHLGNRRVRTVGELLQNQFRMGMLRIEKNVKEKMSTSNIFKMKPSTLINSKPLTAVIGEFFNLSQLSQFMDQTNPLAELTNKRRLTALGPGGLSRERAGLEVRDVHYSHYGRICPIETPEGPNIGLINNLSTYAKINEYGFIETPYRRVENKKVIQENHYLTAHEEKQYVIAQANIRLSENGDILDEEVVCRYQGDNIMASKENIDYVDVSPKQIVSIATSCIPFLENDDANRALMGANMQRQAIPLIKPDAPVVGTGVEHFAAKDSGLAIVSKNKGVVEYVDAKRIVIKTKSGLEEHILDTFLRSNHGTSLTHTPLVSLGEKIDKGQIIADGPSMEKGELALGQNVTVAFTTWNGYNYEDAIIVSERLVYDDLFTSIHIEEYSIEKRKTKQGVEEITREIPNISENSRKFLDEEGIVIIGTEVKPGDILVGKVTPKGQGQQSPEDKLLQAIFGEKSRNVKDNSLRVPNGGGGIVQAIKRFNSEEHDLPNDVKEVLKIYIVQKRKIQEGDKMAGRHGNKGVISKVLPIEDMPHLQDGTPVDIMLNPLGVPSRMNIGQVLELHLGMAAKKLGIKIATPVFDGISDQELTDIMLEAKMDNFGKEILIDGQTGEAFDKPISVGIMYMLKLSHMVDDKIHARNVGPYSLITQQPLGGKAQNGGQRFGEMEVWALESYGAAYTLREILTIKSDDIMGRTKAYEAIVRNKPIPKPGIPESFNVLTKEIQGLGFNMQMIDQDGAVRNINAYDDELDDEDIDYNKLQENEEDKKNEEFLDALAEEYNISERS